MDANTLFWNVDTQYDFMREEYTDLETMEHKEGKMPVPGAEEIERNLSALTNHAYREDIPVVNTADWHNAETEEISTDPDYDTTFPEHCMQDTTGARYVPVTSPDPDDTYRISWEDDTVDPDRLDSNRNTVLYKDKFDVFTGNPHTDTVLDELDPDRVVVYGVATDVCVDFAVQGLLDRGIDVTYVDDAMAGLADDDALDQVTQDWEDCGAEPATTRDIVLGEDHPFAGPHHGDRHNLYLSVLAHPQGAPTVDELRYVTPGMEDDVLEEQLSVMENEYDLVEHDELPETPVIDGDTYSSTFYRATEEGWEEHRDLIGGADPEGVIGIFRTLREHLERPDWMRELEQLPRNGDG